MNCFKRLTALYMSLILTVLVILPTALTGCGSNSASEEMPSQATTDAVPLQSGNNIMRDLLDGKEPGPDDEDNGHSNIIGVGGRELLDLYQGVLAPMWENTGKYPSAFDMTDIYADEAAFNTDYDEIMAWSESLKEYEGKLSSGETIYEFLCLLEDPELNSKYGRLLMYTQLGQSLDITDTYYENLNDRMDELGEIFSKNISFYSMEIMDIPSDERARIFADPIFDDFEYYIKYWAEPDSEALSPEELNKITKLTIAMNDSIDEYEQYRYVDYKPLILTVGTGEMDLTDENYVWAMKKASDAQKAQLTEIYEEELIKESDPHSKILEKAIKANAEIAQISRYDSVLEMTADEAGFDAKVFDLIIAAARKSIPDYQRYLRLHNKALGLDEKFSYDMSTSAASFRPGPFAYDDAIDTIRDVVGVLGDDYIKAYDSIVSGPNIDSADGIYRSSASYCISKSQDLAPHIFLNYKGEYNNMSGLAHELGHAVNDVFTNETQPNWYSVVPIFDTEVCSIMHELLLNSYMIENAVSDEEKLYYLEYLINTYNTSLFTQCMYSEFEDYLYKSVEAGEELHSDEMNMKMAELMETYRGDAIAYNGPHWMYMDHLYYGYYMFQYATSICYATSLMTAILDEDPVAISNYKEFMSMGSSDDAGNILKVAGVDPLDKAAYDRMNAYYKKLVDEYEEIINSRQD